MIEKEYAKSSSELFVPYTTVSVTESGKSLKQFAAEFSRSKNFKIIRRFSKKSKLCQKVVNWAFFSKIEVFAKNRSFCQKSKFLPKIEIFAKNRNFCQKSKFLPKIEVFAKNRSFCQKSKFLPKIEVSAKNRSFCQKSKFLPKIEVFAKNRSFC